jgi:hypothetical protein
VAFQCEQVFAGEEDRFDPLPDRSELNASVGFVLAGWPDDQAAELLDGVFELGSGIALVADDRLAAFEGPGEQG